MMGGIVSRFESVRAGGGGPKMQKTKHGDRKKL